MADSINTFLRFGLLLSITFLVGTASPRPKVVAQDQRLVMRLIHRDSILSPFYNKSSTISDRFNLAKKNSLARLAYLIEKSNQFPFSIKDIRSPVIPDSRGYIFLANVSIGHPHIPQLLIMDTGSPLLWVQCQPCIKCHRTLNPIYDALKSSSYVASSCHTSYCNNTLFSGHCDSAQHCAFVLRYLDQSNSTGNLAFENFSFVTSDEGIAVVPHVLFGCATNVNESPEPDLNGIIGLSADTSSILSSVGHKFSYCFGNISDRNYLYNQLILGDGAIIEGGSAPFEERKGLYYVSLKGITVGDKEIKFNPEQYKFNVMIDCGSALSFLTKNAYEPLRAEVEKRINGSLPRLVDPERPNSLCYQGDMERDLTAIGFPTVTFKFSEEAQIDLEIQGMFIKVNDNDFCMAVDSDSTNINIIGVIAQQFYNVGYDIDNKKISFERIDCILYEEKNVMKR